MSKFSLAGKTAVITGGAGGLGRAMIAAYAEAGANVVVASRNREKIEAEAAAIRDKGQSAVAIAVDVTDAEQVDNLVANTVMEFGALDIIVNNVNLLRQRTSNTRWPTQSGSRRLWTRLRVVGARNIPSDILTQYRGS